MQAEKEHEQINAWKWVMKVQLNPERARLSIIAPVAGVWGLGERR